MNIAETKQEAVDPFSEMDLDHEIYLALRKLGELLPQNENEVALEELEIGWEVPARPPMPLDILGPVGDPESEACTTSLVGDPIKDEELHILALLSEGGLDHLKLYDCLKSEYEVDTDYDRFLIMLGRLVSAGLVVERIFSRGKGLSRLHFRCYETTALGAETAFFESNSVPFPSSAQIAEQSYDPSFPV